MSNKFPIVFRQVSVRSLKALPSLCLEEWEKICGSVASVRETCYFVPNSDIYSCFFYLRDGKQ